MFPMNEERKTRWTPQKKKKKTELELQNFNLWREESPKERRCKDSCIGHVMVDFI